MRNKEEKIDKEEKLRRIKRERKKGGKVCLLLLPVGVVGWG